MSSVNIRNLCLRCREKKESSEFYKTTSKIYKYTDHVPYCRDCIEDIYQIYLKRFNNPIKAIQRTCMALDLYYSEKIAAANVSNGELSFRSYGKRLNMAQFRNKTFDNSLDEGMVWEGDEEVIKEKERREKAEEKKEKKESAQAPLPVAVRDVDMWGAGFTYSDYEALNAHYKFLKAANPKCDSNQEIFIKDLCYINMQKLKAVCNDRIDDYNKLTDSYRKTFIQAGLKSVQETNMGDDDMLGVWNARISQYTPEEYYKDKKLYEDHDGLKDYIQRFILRPLKNLQFGTDERDPEYYVDESVDENVDDEYEEEE